MKKFLFVLGSALYGVIVSLALWWGFSNSVEGFMDGSWKDFFRNVMYFILYVASLHTFVILIATYPLSCLCKREKKALYAPIVAYIIWGLSSVVYPWLVCSYNFRECLAAGILSLFALVTTFILIFIPKFTTWFEAD